jgi:hypothetical protein
MRRAAPQGETPDLQRSSAVLLVCSFFIIIHNVAFMSCHNHVLEIELIQRQSERRNKGKTSHEQWKSHWSWGTKLVHRR